MRKFKYREPENTTVIILEAEIVHGDYWCYWINKVRKSLRAQDVLKLPIEEQREICLQDFLATHWAWEVTDEQ